MSLNAHRKNGWRGAISSRALFALAALFALLAIRNAPPSFPKPLSPHHSSVKAVSGSDQRPHFVADGLQWAALVGHFLPFPPTAESPHLAYAFQPWSTLQAKGFHYNRPPPTT